MLHGRAHHEEADGYTDGDEDLDQLRHPREPSVPLRYDLRNIQKHVKHVRDDLKHTRNRIEMLLYQRFTTRGHHFSFLSTSGLEH